MSQNSTQKTSNGEVQWMGMSACFEETGLVTSCGLEGGCFPIFHSCELRCIYWLAVYLTQHGVHMQFFSLSMSTNGQIKYEVVESYIVKAAVHYIDHIYFEKSLTRYCKITFGVELVAVDFSTFNFKQVN